MPVNLMKIPAQALIGASDANMRFRRLGYYTMCLALLALAIWGISFLHRKTANTAPLRFASTLGDLGEVAQGTKTHYVFHFSNASENSVSITSKPEGCACTAPTVSPSLVLPRSTGTVDVLFDSKGLSGPVEKTVSVTVRHYPYPQFLTIRAIVRAPITITPRQIDFGVVRSGETTTTQVLIHNVSGRDIEIKQFKRPTYIRVRSPSRVRNQKEINLFITLEQPPVGEFEEIITLETFPRGRQEYTIPFRAKVFSKWKLSPERFYTGFLNVGDVYTGKVTVEGLPISHLRRVWTTVMGASVTASPGQLADSLDLTMRLDSRGAREGRLKGFVYISTTETDQPLLVIPVLGSILDPSISCCSKSTADHR